MTTTRLTVLAAILASVSASHALAQGQEFALGLSGSELAADAGPTADGGFIVTGSDGTGAIRAPVLARFNADATLAWMRRYPPQGDSSGVDVLQAADGGFVFSMSTDEIAGFDRGLVKVLPDGAVDWAAVYEGDGFSGELRIHRLPDGGILMTGDDRIGVPGPVVPVLTRTDADGNLVWQRGFLAPALDDILNARFNDAVFVPGADGSGDIYACGTISDSDDPNTTSRGLVARLDAGGNPVWAREFDAPGGVEEFSGIEIIDGVLAIAGFDTAVNASTLTLVRTDGTLISQTAYEFFGTGGVIEITPAGNILMAGRTRDLSLPPGVSRAVLLETDASGVPLRTREFGGDTFSFGTGLVPLADGAVMPMTTLSQISGSFDIAIVRTDGALSTPCSLSNPVNPVARAPSAGDVQLVAVSQSGWDFIGIGTEPIGPPIDALCACPPCACDWAEPLGVCNFNDVIAYLGAFSERDPCADIASAGPLDFNDVVLFLQQFAEGCPGPLDAE